MFIYAYGRTWGETSVKKNFHVDAIDAERNPNVEIKDAIRWTKLSWDEVTESCIKNCWRHTGILPAEIGSISTDMDADIQSTSSLHNEFRNIFERLAIPTELLMTPTEYLEIDRDLTTCQMMTDTDILQLVSDGQAESGSDEKSGVIQGEEGQEEDQEAKSESIRVSHDQATSAIDTLMRFFEQSDYATSDDIQGLCLIKRRLASLTSSSKKQSSLLNYFSRH